MGSSKLEQLPTLGFEADHVRAGSTCRRTPGNIAEKLNVSQNTVRNHTKSIYRKLDIHTQQELLDRLESHTPQDV